MGDWDRRHSHGRGRCGRCLVRWQHRADAAARPERGSRIVPARRNPAHCLEVHLAALPGGGAFKGFVLCHPPASDSPFG